MGHLWPMCIKDEERRMKRDSRICIFPFSSKPPFYATLCPQELMVVTAKQRLGADEQRRVSGGLYAELETKKDPMPQGIELTTLESRF